MLLPRSTINNCYIQDDWKATPKLTFNLGVRYSNEAPFNTKYGLMSNFDTTAIDPLTGAKVAIVHSTASLSKRDNTSDFYSSDLTVSNSGLIDA